MAFVTKTFNDIGKGIGRMFTPPSGMMGAGGQGGNITIESPEPVAPPRTPLSSTETAALQRARAGSPKSANKDIVLTSTATRAEDVPVVRRTLAGG